MTSLGKSADDQQPEAIGDYQILHELGSGGMGTVYLARHRLTSEQFAVKLLPPSMARESGFRERFSREIQALQQLQSPHIVQFYTSGEVQGTVYYVMEYVPGETLADRLRLQRKLPWKEAVEITLQLCIALKAAHDAGVIHRDLKPSNILIDPQGVVKLSDFGIAQIFAADKLTVTGGIVGTAEYMSPEQATGQRASKRSDLYSLGAVLYVMLTGRPPFVGQTSIDIMQKHRYAQFDLPSRFVPELPLDLDQIVTQLLEKEPTRRIPDAYVLSRRLQEMVQKQSLKYREQPTTVEGRALPLESGAPSPPSGPGEATLMSDLIRSQLAQENDPKGIQRYLDNVWVLCGLLACVVAAAGWMAFGGMTDEQRFQKGVALMQSPAGADWIRARDEYFQPLVDKDPSAWEEKTSRFLKEIRIYSLEQRLLSSRRIGQRNAPRTEIERQMRRIRKLWDDGALAEAERRLRSVRILWKDDESAADMLRIATAWSEELQQQLATFPDPLPFVREKLRQADIQKAAEAEQTRQAIRELYSNDPLVEAAIMPRGETSSKVANESSHQ